METDGIRKGRRAYVVKAYPGAPPILCSGIVSKISDGIVTIRSVGTFGRLRDDCVYTNRRDAFRVYKHRWEQHLQFLKEDKEDLEHDLEVIEKMIVRATKMITKLCSK